MSRCSNCIGFGGWSELEAPTVAVTCPECAGTGKEIVQRGPANPTASGWCVDRLGAYREGPSAQLPEHLFADLLVPSRFFGTDKAGNRASAEAFR